VLLNDYRGPKVTRLRAVTRLDRHGDPVEDWAVPDRRRLLGATAQPVSETEEDGVTRYLVGVQKLYVRGRADLTATDRVEIAGDGIWRVDGEPKHRKPFASGPFTVAVIRRLTGVTS
jgi:hypothetical protein